MDLEVLHIVGQAPVRPVLADVGQGFESVIDRSRIALAAVGLDHLSAPDESVFGSRVLVAVSKIHV